MKSPQINESREFVTKLNLIGFPFSLLIFWFINKQMVQENSAISFLLGSLLALGNLSILAYVLKAFFQEKLVAWAAFLIVSKHLILGFIIYYIATREWFHALFFCAGFSSILFIATGTFFLGKKEIKVNNGSL